jgi:hypothetical protein
VLGGKLHHLRTLSKGAAEIQRPADSLLVWMGDSTMISKSDNLAYHIRVSNALRPKVESLTRTRPGLTFYHFYLLMGDVLEFEPDVIVANLTLRLMDPSLGHPVEGLTSSIPTAELARALTLPFNGIGLTIPHLLLKRLLRFPWFEQAYYFLTGLRDRFHDASFWPAGKGRLTAMRFPLPDGPDKPNFAAYDHEISRTDPMVRMIAATVALAVRNGVEMLVMVSPIPWQRLHEFDLYDRQRTDRRIQIIRGVVEAAGGRLIDLHALLTRDEFRDSLGHVTSFGNEKIKRKLLPVVHRMLDSR